MSGKMPVVYWDTNVLLAYCKQEKKHGEDILSAIDEIVQEIESKVIHLATSTLSLAELVRGKPNNDQIQIINSVFLRTNTHLIDTNQIIAELAGDIYCKIGSNSKTKLTIPDCIHLASALYFKCEVFYTLDGINGKPDGILTYANLLKTVYGITISKPSIVGTLPLKFES